MRVEKDAKKRATAEKTAFSADEAVLKDKIALLDKQLKEDRVRHREEEAEMRKRKFKIEFIG